MHICTTITYLIGAVTHAITAVECNVTSRPADAQIHPVSTARLDRILSTRTDVYTRKSVAEPSV